MALRISQRQCLSSGHAFPAASARTRYPQAPCGARGAAHVMHAHSGEKDAFVGSWLDLASLVSGASGDESATSLASRVGDEVYISVCGWHLYLRDVQQMHTAVASAIMREGCSRDTITSILSRIPVTLGDGKLDSQQVSLRECVPEACVHDLVDIAEDALR